MTILLDNSKILSFSDRFGFREWLNENRDKEAECWVVVKKGKPSDENYLYYLDAVEEALCFGWIDSTNKTVEQRTIQRFSPRKKSSPWSELNIERCRRLEKLRMMTDAGRAALPETAGEYEFIIDPDISDAFNNSPLAWENFRKFPILYQRVRIDTIQRDKRKDIELFRKRLARLIDMSEQGKMFGEWNDFGRLLDY